MITLEDVIDFNKEICKVSGEESFLINKDNVLSALSVQQWYSDKCLLASALIRSLTIGHGFQDGNKRTAACIGMYILDFECSEDDMISCILDIAQGIIRDVEEIASILYPDSYTNLKEE